MKSFGLTTLLMFCFFSFAFGQEKNYLKSDSCFVEKKTKNPFYFNPIKFNPLKKLEGIGEFGIYYFGKYEELRKRLEKFGFGSEELKINYEGLSFKKNDIFSGNIEGNFGGSPKELKFNLKFKRNPKSFK